jgi:type IV pilus assembly protein PilY1
MNIVQANKLKKIAAAILVLQLSLAPVGNAAYAAVTDLTDIPLAAYSGVKPNIMYTLDNSGSMHYSTVTGYDGLAEYTAPNPGSNAARNTHAYYSGAYNLVYYDPATTYKPAVTPLAISLGNANPAATRLDPFVNWNGAGTGTAGGTLNTVNLTERCTPSNLVTPPLPSYGVTTAGNGLYVTATAANGNCATNANGVRARYAFYYLPSATANLQTATPADTDFPVANRVDIIPTRLTYPKAATRTDCVTTPSTTAPTVCSYQEEIQNFANWFSYYRTRINMTKSALGLVFAGLEDRFRIGFNTINDAAYNNQTAPALDTDYWQNVRDFNPAQKAAWFDKLYKVYPANGTPLRNQMQKIGRYYSGQLKSLGAADPLQYSCQSNYHIMSTDGFWNATEATPSNPVVGNQDNTQADGYSTLASGSFDGTGQSNTLADVAMYYYKNDLRPGVPGSAACIGAIPGVDVCENIVKTNRKDKATHQHMTTFTIGLGANGQNPYFDDYETRSDLAYAGKGYDANFWLSKLKAGNASFSWPVPVGDTRTTIDDLWHAAVNARGTYLNAGDPASLTKGLTKILNEIAAREASSAGAALTSNSLTASVSAGAFTVGYDSGDWSGNLTANTLAIDPITGFAITTPAWYAQPLLDTLAAGTGWKDNRKIFTVGKDDKPSPFIYDKLSSTQQTALVNKDILAYIRGDNSNTSFRFRKHVLGDIVNSEPTYVKEASANYLEITNPGYAKFKLDALSRLPVVYVGGNDGMLHAFNGQVDLSKDANGGKELWAFVPPLVYQGPNNTPAVDGLAALANPDYIHHPYVDAKPMVRDVDFKRTGGDPKAVATNSTDWRTLLVSGYGKGGKGFFALDVTNPANDAGATEQNLADAKVLWQFTDPDMGYSFGRPQIAKTRKWGWVVVVSSGYNNITGSNPGQGFIYILNAATGALLQKIGTGVGSAADPSGLTYLDGYYVDEGDYTIEQVYGGDLFGNLWRLDVSQAATVAGDFPAPVKIAVMTDGTNTQPITTPPLIALGTNNVDRYVVVGTGKLLGTTDRADAKTQSFYVFRDGAKTAPYLPATLPAGFSFPLKRTDFAQLLDPLAGISTTGKIGWYINLGHDSTVTSPSERVVIRPTVTTGAVVFATTIPTIGNACSGDTKSNIYGVSLEKGKSLIKDENGLTLAFLASKIGIEKTQGAYVKGKFKVLTTNSRGEVEDPLKKQLGSDIKDGVPHRFYWRETLQ